MSEQMILMLHPTFGVLAMVAAVWVFVDTLNASGANDNDTRVRSISKLAAVLMWLTYVVGGYWYVTYYGADKAIIKAGPWPFAHSLFMESKEHLFLMLIMLATFLPIAASGGVWNKPGNRVLVLWTSALIVLMSLAMEGAGALINMGVKVALLANI